MTDEILGRRFAMEPHPKGWKLICGEESTCVEVAAMMAAFNCTATINPVDGTIELIPILDAQPRPNPMEIMALYATETPPQMLRTLVLRDAPHHVPGPERAN